MKNSVSKAFTSRCAVSGAMVFMVLTGLWSSTAQSQQTDYIKASNAEAGDSFAHSVAVSGSTLIVGAVGEDSNATRVNGDETNNSSFDNGAAYAYVRDQFGVWNQQAYLKFSRVPPGGTSNFGHSVSISGDTAVISEPWASLDDGGSGGAAFVFTRNGEDWCNEVEVEGELVCRQDVLRSSNFEPGDSFGLVNAISGNTVVVGAPFEYSNATGVNGDENDNSMAFSGAAYVFVRNEGVWSQQAYLKASNTGPNDRFGTSVSISGDTIVVGAFLESSNATGVNSLAEDNDLAAEAGAAYVFVRNGNVWSQQAYLKASNTGASDWFGSDVAVSGDTVVVGARGEDSDAIGVDGDGSTNSESSSGAAYVFVRDELGDWSQDSYLKASNTGAGDQFGSKVAISGNTLAVSAQFEDDVVIDSGATYVFFREGAGSWGELFKLKASNPGSADRFGGSLAISDKLLVAGSWFEDSNATGINGEQTNNLASNAGAAYAFTVDGVDIPPIVLAFSLIPDTPVVQGAVLELEALGSDVNRGGQVITGAEYRIDNGTWVPMSAFDGIFNSELEQIQGFADTTALNIGMHTACVRATQNGGLKSAEVCLDFEVVEVGELDDFMVVCMHDPLWPKAGETVDFSLKVLRLPVDGSGTPFSVENVEIWFEDPTGPKWQNETPGVWSLYATSPKLLGGSFTYGCRARHGDKAVFTGWRTVAVGSLPAGKPVPVIYTGPKSDRIDYVFIADEDSYTGPDDPAFLDNVKDVIEDAIYEFEIFNQHQHQFNFWLARSTGDADGYTKELGCQMTKPDDWDENYAFADVGAVLHSDEFRDCADKGLFSSEWYFFPTFRHESGHDPFGLADEYCCDGGYWEEPFLPNVYTTLESCEAGAPDLGKQAEDCRDWDSTRNDKTYYTSEPSTNDLMSDRGDPQAADFRRIQWLFEQCGESEC